MSVDFLLCLQYLQNCEDSGLIPPTFTPHIIDSHLKSADLSAWGWTTPGVAWAGLSATNSGYKNLSTAVDVVNAQGCQPSAVYTRASVRQCAADISGCYVNDLTYAVRAVLD